MKEAAWIIGTVLAVVMVVVVLFGPMIGRALRQKKEASSTPPYLGAGGATDGSESDGKPPMPPQAE